MPEWTSVEEIVQRFRLAVSSSDLPGVLDELKRKLVEAHPDRNGGDFPSPELKARFIDLQSSIEYVEQKSKVQNALVPMSQVSALVEAVTQAIVRREQAPTSPAQSYIQIVEEVRTRLRRAYLGPKISSGVALAVSSAVFAFMGSLKDHPILGNYVASQTFVNLLLFTWIASGFLFVFLWFREGQVEAQAEHLLSDEVLGEIFPLLCRMTIRRGRAHMRPGSFQVRDLAELNRLWWNWGRRAAEKYLDSERMESDDIRQAMHPAFRLARIVRGRSIDVSVAQKVA